MDRTYIQWNVVNWITIVLMAALGMMIVGAVTSGVRAYRGGSSDDFSS